MHWETAFPQYGRTHLHGTFSAVHRAGNQSTVQQQAAQLSEWYPWTDQSQTSQYQGSQSANIHRNKAQNFSLTTRGSTGWESLQSNNSGVTRERRKQVLSSSLLINDCVVVSENEQAKSGNTCIFLQLDQTILQDLME